MDVTIKGYGADTFVSVNDIIRVMYREASISTNSEVRDALVDLADRIGTLGQ